MNWSPEFKSHALQFKSLRLMFLSVFCSPMLHLMKKKMHLMVQN